MNVIAIDGPSSSGKSSVASGVAGSLGYSHLDTGAMYRAATWAVLNADADVHNSGECSNVVKKMQLVVGPPTLVNGVDVTSDIRGEVVASNVSKVSAHPEVRRLLVEQQRLWVSAHGDCVVEGRDIGTVVFPDATLKVYLTASPLVRAKRRLHDPKNPQPMDLETMAASIAERDQLDSSRADSPLRVADDAVVIDTSDMDLEVAIEAVLELLG